MEIDGNGNIRQLLKVLGDARIDYSSAAAYNKLKKDWKNETNKITGHFKAIDFEHEFLEHYYGSKLTRWKWLIFLGILINDLFIPIDYFNRGVFPSESYWWSTIISRIVPTFLMVFALIALYFKRVQERKHIGEVIAFMVCVLLCVGTTMATLTSIHTDVIKMTVHGEILVIYLAITAMRLRTIFGLLLVCICVTIKIGSMLVLHVVNLRFKIIPQVIFYMLTCIIAVFQTWLSEREFRKLFEKQKRMVKYVQFLEAESERKILLLGNIFPKNFLSQILQRDSSERVFYSHDKMTLVLADLVGFSEFSLQVGARKLIRVVNVIFSNFDDVTRKSNLELIKTIGDAYYVADLNNKGSRKCIGFAFLLLEALKGINETYKWDFEMRIGISCGKCIIAFVGKMYSLDIFGSPVTEVMLCEKLSHPGRIVCSEEVKKGNARKYTFEQHDSPEHPQYYFIGDEVVKPSFSSGNTLHRALTTSNMLEFEQGEGDNIEFQVLKSLSLETADGSGGGGGGDQMSVKSSSTTTTSSSAGSGGGDIFEDETILKYRYFPLMFHRKKDNMDFIDFVLERTKTQTCLTCGFVLCFILLYVGSLMLYDARRLYDHHALILNYCNLFVALLVFVLSCIPCLNTKLASSRVIMIAEYFNVTVFLASMLCLPPDIAAEISPQENMPVLILLMYFQFTNIPIEVRTIWAVVVCTGYSVAYIIVDGLREALVMFFITVFISVISYYLLELSLLKSYREKRIMRMVVKRIRVQVHNNRQILASTIPSFVVKKIRRKNKGLSKFQYFDELASGAVLFAQVAGMDFHQVEAAEQIMNNFNTAFFMFDNIVKKHRCTKVKSIFDTYIVLHEDDFGRILKCAFAMREEFLKKTEGLTIRIGVHKGCIYGGIVGQSKMLYDIFAPTINICSRMCTLSEENKIQSCLPLIHLISQHVVISEKRKIFVKGLSEEGTFTDTYYIDKE